MRFYCSSRLLHLGQEIEPCQNPKRPLLKGIPNPFSTPKGATLLTSVVELRRDSRVTTGISAFPLGWPWEAQSAPQVARDLIIWAADKERVWTKQLHSPRSRLGSASGHRQSRSCVLGGEAPLVRMQKPSLCEVGSLSQLWVFLLQIVFKSRSAPDLNSKIFWNTWSLPSI